ncbi:hypothetical protein MCJ35_24260 [Enterocloster sp. OA13]|uniref:hypothetical protein n=1 Tax=Enterocloster sp. OA13 TaxID=2914161 RepID=UPI00046EBD3A|nr:hypothetical protein [Enterocloster sp. OA13]
MELLFENEAIARAAIDAGAEFCSAYPITPVTTIVGSREKVFHSYIRARFFSDAERRIQF